LSGQLPSVLQKFLGKHLKALLGVVQYCHLAAALGRHLLAIEIDADKDSMTMGMDAAAGRTTSVSESVYALSNNLITTLNDRHMAMSHASARPWQSGLFKLQMKGAIATAGQIEAPTVDLNTDGSLNASATSSVDQTTLLHSIKSLFSKLEALLLPHSSLEISLLCHSLHRHLFHRQSRLVHQVHPSAQTIDTVQWVTSWYVSVCACCVLSNCQCLGSVSQ
jgi:hypothetical protein